MLIALCLEWPLSKILFINERDFVDVVYIHIIGKPSRDLWLNDYKALEQQGPDSRLPYAQCIQLFGLWPQVAPVLMAPHHAWGGMTSVVSTGKYPSSYSS